MDPKQTFQRAKAAQAQTLPELLHLAFEAGGECKDLWSAGGHESVQATALAAAINAARDCAGERDLGKIRDALRLCLLALEKEYGGTPEDAEYDDLVDRIRAVLGASPQESEAHRCVRRLLDGTDDVDDALNDIFGQDPQKEFDHKLKSAFQQPDANAPMTTLGDMLDNIPPMIVDQIMEIVNSPASDSEFTRQIRPLLRRFEADLTAADIVPDYLAYALLYARRHLRGQL